ncbi:MAG: hypothetical protein M3619_00680 [Myxococcota bacterium]|nr:hypothetical protein [Myxococcota bacterium]
MAHSASSRSGGRFIDLAISVRVADVERDAKGIPRWRPGTDAELARVGGRWDRRRRRWSSRPTSKLLIIRFHRGQEAVARWFVDWLRRFVGNSWSNYRRAWSVLLIGGRRSGKTHVACAAMIIFGILTPGSILWAISPTLETGDELDTNFQEMLPRGWYTRRQAKTGRSTTYRLANGSRILLKSGVKPQRLKAGRVDMALLNEAQELSQLAYVKLRAPIADRGGIVLMTANPPDSPAGRWVEDYYVAARAREIEAEVFELDPRNNPWINYEALASIGAEIDAKTYERDVLGLFPPIGDIVMHGWSDRESIRDVPESFIDITAIVTKQKLGRAAGYVVGMDFQQTPHMAAAVHKFFRDPTEPDEVIPWVVDEVVVEEADENDLLDALEDLPRWQHGDGKPETREARSGYRGWLEAGDDKDEPVHCAVVMDASAWWQDGAHTKGRQSDRLLAARRWSFCYRPRPEPDKKNNPEISERVKVTNARLKNAHGRRRMFSCHHNERVNRAMRSWENSKVSGQPNRRSDFAHLCDSVSYVIYRFFGKPKVKGAKQEYRGVDRRTRAHDMRAW